MKKRDYEMQIYTHDRVRLMRTEILKEHIDGIREAVDVVSRSLATPITRGIALSKKLSICLKEYLWRENNEMWYSADRGYVVTMSNGLTETFETYNDFLDSDLLKTEEKLNPLSPLSHVDIKGKVVENKSLLGDKNKESYHE